MATRNFNPAADAWGRATFWHIVDARGREVRVNSLRPRVRLELGEPIPEALATVWNSRGGMAVDAILISGVRATSMRMQHDPMRLGVELDIDIDATAISIIGEEPTDEPAAAEPWQARALAEEGILAPLAVAAGIRAAGAGARQAYFRALGAKLREVLGSCPLVDEMESYTEV